MSAILLGKCEAVMEGEVGEEGSTATTEQQHDVSVVGYSRLALCSCCRRSFWRAARGAAVSLCTVLSRIP
jgi:uncharacterized protein YuzB (UPF0349 family)